MERDSENSGGNLYHASVDRQGTTFTEFVDWLSNWPNLEVKVDLRSERRWERNGLLKHAQVNIEQKCSVTFCIGYKQRLKYLQSMNHKYICS